MTFSTHSFSTHNNWTTIYSPKVSNDDWSQLCDSLNSNSVRHLYFHYASTYDPTICANLLVSLGNATDLKSVWFKGSTFDFKNSDGQCRKGLGKLFDSLHSHQHLEEIQIRNYNLNELDEIFEHLVPLLEKNKSIKKLTLWHLPDDCTEKLDNKKFKFLCDLLAKKEVEFELNMEYSIELSEENKILLKNALQANKFIKVSDAVKKTLEAVKDKNERFDSGLNFLLLSGCFEVAGITAVAIAYTVLNAATLGVSGLVVASLGAVSILAGIGLFAYDCYKANENKSNSNIDFRAAVI